WTVMLLKSSVNSPISSRRLLVGTRKEKSPLATRRAAIERYLIGRVKRHTTIAVKQVVTSNTASVYRSDRRTCRSSRVVRLLAEPSTTITYRHPLTVSTGK